MEDGAVRSRAAAFELAPVAILRDRFLHAEYLELAKPMRQSIQERLERTLHHIPECGCILCDRTPAGGGHIQLRVNPEDAVFVYAHRIAWALAHDEWPPNGLKVLHRCDTPACCNPAHHFLGTAQDNSDDMVAKGRWRGGKRLSSLDVKIILAARAEGMNQGQISRAYGYHPGTVSRYINQARRLALAAVSENRCRDIVAQRSGGICEVVREGVCLGRASSMHHRRKHGRVWTPSNVIHVCGDGTTGCHGWIPQRPVHPAPPDRPTRSVPATGYGRGAVPQSCRGCPAGTRAHPRHSLGLEPRRPPASRPSVARMASGVLPAWRATMRPWTRAPTIR
jgi:hypothetical protein